MTYVPVVPQTGLLGWNFLSRSLDVQQKNFNESGVVSREVAAFRERISDIRTAEDLVNDRELLSVSLTAFGLEEDIDNRFFIKKILSDGSLSPDALANKFSDSRYLALTKAFGFGDFDTPRTQLSYFPDEIISAYTERSFEIAVGEQDEDMRLALSLNREVSAVISSGGSDDTQWYKVLGSAPLKLMFEEALFLPSEFGSVAIDKQVDILKDATQSIFGKSSFDVFHDADNIDKLRTRFLLASQMNNQQPVVGASAALSLLQNRISFQF